MTQIIALSGRKQSGKTTLSNTIKEYYLYLNKDLKIKIYNFADPLKQDICMNILGLTYDQCYGDDIDKNTLTDISWSDQLLTARQVMEIVGTDIFRKLKNNVWVDATLYKIQQENYDISIIGDCRFPNEVQSIRNAGGLVVRLTRDPFNSNSLSEKTLDKDVFDWNNFDIVLDNANMTLQEQDIEIIKQLKIKEILPL
jgi:cytidylate kinase